ncbi:MAG: ABC transporter permease [Cyanomargarita calcarea GSE-NOS-MK-12-04C]|jgi:simple sugar transport system permease protein|uniref:ABC transporter permease n=1 Tax=Cyanomargarita calcarea GSE-NOS-MK-12-04C TaxID=2839659 RepID=A0A951QKX2_9CYAN|nr:ABC transporter permease [Cyanomargarita calcarea GSE-NOS-MK-12-04C]
MKTSFQKLIIPIISPLIAILSALLVGAILIIIAGANPITAYTALFQESLSTYFGFGNTLTKMTPLLFTSLGVLIALKAGQYNIGGEGQIYLGALGSTLIGLYLQNLPTFIHIPLALSAGFIFGGIWGFIPGYLKAIRGVNEVITTLLLNYIAINLISYLVQNPLKEPNAPSPYSPLIAKSAQLPIILPGSLAHAGILFSAIAAVILWVIINRSTLGYQIKAVGFNPNASRYAGMDVQRTIILVMTLAGGLAGLAGSCEVMGLKYRLFDLVSPGYGFDAIAIAFLSRGSVIGVVLSSLFFGALRSGANVMQRSAGVPVTVVYAIQGLTVLFIAISLALEYRFKKEPQI